ncbi:MAG TPA: hypothetical protein VGM18_12815 [Candidatus Sulfotelmatobacter sp.]|jgi:hypothetical protein
MFLNRCKFVVVSIILILIAAPVLGADREVKADQEVKKDQLAYCSYLMEQAEAQRDLLRTPVAAAGFTQPETGLPLQIVGGASVGLSDIRKASLTMDVARKNCALYKATTGAQQDVQYALTSLEKEALGNRLTLIDEAAKSLDTLMERTAKMVETQNATRLMLFALQTTRIKLDADRADTQLKITVLYVPPLSEKPLKELVAEKLGNEANEQRALDKLNRQNNWDVALSVGIHQQANPVAYGPQPYGAVSLNYNLASRAINKHLDRAAESYGEWKKVQEGDVVRNAEVLHRQLVDSVSVQESKLKTLEEESVQIEKNLAVVDNPDTSIAFDFHNQLSAAQLLLRIETGDATFRLARLREYLARNY